MYLTRARCAYGVVRNCRRLCSFSSRLKESTAALRSRLPLAVPVLFELFVKRERRQQVSYRILPNFVEFLVGRLDLGCRHRLLQMRHPRGAAPAGFRQRAARTVTVTKTVPLLQASARRHEQLVLRSHVQVWLVLKK